MAIQWKKLGVQRGKGAAEPVGEARGYRDPSPVVPEPAMKVCAACGVTMPGSEAFFDHLAREVCGTCHQKEGLAVAELRAAASIERAEVSRGPRGFQLVSFAVSISIACAIVALWRAC